MLTLTPAGIEILRSDKPTRGEAANVWDVGKSYYRTGKAGGPFHRVRNIPKRFDPEAVNWMLQFAYACWRQGCADATPKAPA